MQMKGTMTNYQELKKDKKQYQKQLLYNKLYRRRRKRQERYTKAEQRRQKFLTEYPQWKELRARLDCLTRTTITEYYCLDNYETRPPSMQDVGNRLGMSRQAVSLRIKKGLKQLEDKS